METPVDEVVGEFVGFAQALRRAGVTSARTNDFVAALGALDPMRRADVYWAGRATLCSSPDDLEIYEKQFAEWFSGINVARVAASSQVTVPTQTPGADGAGEEPDQPDDLIMLASTAELLRNRDVAKLNEHEARLLAVMFGRLRVKLPMRTVRRREPHRRGEVDVAAMVREQMRRAGEPSEMLFRRRRRKPRRIVFLIDVSRSMNPYADQMLRLAHRVVTAAPGRVEVFTMGTRLTRVTRALRFRDSQKALDAAGKTIPDWSGGTRLGEVIEAFIDRWGRRGVARGAVVIVMSDGWERGDAALLEQQVAALARFTHSIVWVNPHSGKEGFEPIQAGMIAVLPNVDHIVAGHTFATFENLLEVVSSV